MPIEFWAAVWGSSHRVSSWSRTTYRAHACKGRYKDLTLTLTLTLSSWRRFPEYINKLRYNFVIERITFSALLQ